MLLHLQLLEISKSLENVHCTHKICELYAHPTLNPSFHNQCVLFALFPSVEKFESEPLSALFHLVGVPVREIDWGCHVALHKV